MIPKGNALYSMIYQKCPKCHEGDLFKGRTYQKGFAKMNETCSHCGLHYEQEPSFFSGAMYVSYALQVAIFTTVYVALRVLFNPDTNVYIVSTIGAAILLLPLTLRLSRSIYINFFIDYDGEVSKRKMKSGT